MDYGTPKKMDMEWDSHVDQNQNDYRTDNVRKEPLNSPSRNPLYRSDSSSSLSSEDEPPALPPARRTKAHQKTQYKPKKRQLELTQFDPIDTDAGYASIQGSSRPSLVSPPPIKEEEYVSRKKRQRTRREKLTFCSIVYNVIYNVLLFAIIIATSAGVYMYEWVEASQEDMLGAGIFVDTAVPGFKSVSCGLITYCIDAAGAVSECTLPWPRYGGMFHGILGAPYLHWKITAGLMVGGVGCITIAWLYTFFACFGCFHTKVQKAMTSLVVIGALLQVAALILFAYSFGDLAVDTCRSPNINATATSDPPCTEWYATLPSEVIEGKGNAACRICPNAVGPFTMASSCSFGWGAKIAAGSCVLALIVSSCGKKIRARKIKGLRPGLDGLRQESTV
eukprot:m.45902 g.45902  ORF g.45902 m.45902 type:complete len:393 (-) comp20081_c0_seq1:39-1217(-)